MCRIDCSRRPARRRPAVVGLAVLALLTGYAGLSYGSPERADIPEATVRSLDAINRSKGVPDVVQNLVPGARAARDAAEAAYRAAGGAADPLSKPQYLVVWAGKMIVGDLSGSDLARFTP